MTTINRAFIKAYRHDAAQPTPSGPVLGDAVRRAVLAADGAAAAAGPEISRGTPRGKAAPAGGAAGQVLPDARPAEKRPLSSFIARADAVPAGAQPAETGNLLPRTTIASIRWPEVCRLLIQHFSEQLDHVADRLIAEADNGRSMIGVVGLFGQCGATTMALCLAGRLAARGRRLVLVDGNFLKPSLADLLDTAATAGWDDVLQHGVPLADAAVRAADDRFDLLPSGSLPSEEALCLVGGLQTIATTGLLRHAYDVTLVDLGTYFAPSSRPVVLELIRNMGLDSVLAVAGPTPADRRDLDSLAEQLDQSGCELLGVIENRIAKSLGV